MVGEHDTFGQAGSATGVRQTAVLWISEETGLNKEPLS